MLQLCVLAAADTDAGIESLATNGRPCPKRLASSIVSRKDFVSVMSRHGVNEAEAETLFEDLKEQPGRDSDSSTNSSKEGFDYFQWTHRVSLDSAGHEGPLKCLSKASAIPRCFAAASVSTCIALLLGLFCPVLHFLLSL